MRWTQAGSRKCFVSRLKPCRAWIVFDAFEDAGFKVGAGLVWKKDRLVLARTEWKYIHEPIVWGWRKDGKHKWYGDQKQTSAFEFDRIKNSKKDDFSYGYAIKTVISTVFKRKNDHVRLQNPAWSLLYW